MVSPTENTESASSGSSAIRDVMDGTQTSTGWFPIIGTAVTTPVQSLFIVPLVLLMIPNVLLMVPELLMVPVLLMVP